jgi:pimeloyl-ACP methyl ester carboxylesterase
MSVMAPPGLVDSMTEPTWGAGSRRRGVHPRALSLAFSRALRTFVTAAWGGGDPIITPAQVADGIDAITRRIHPMADRIHASSPTIVGVTRPLFVLPGIGGDERLFDAQRAVRDIRTIAWIPHAHRRETMMQYAHRLAARLHIDAPFDLGGSSFGGMVALELARYLAPENVFLFGSCRSPRSIAPSLRALRWVTPVLPDRLLHPPASLRRPVAWWFGATTAAHAQLFADMLASTPIEFLRWASNAVASWKGVAELPMPIHHVHGERDRLIPVRRVHADRVIVGAGHLLNVTHAREVNAFIADVDQRARGGR